MEEAQSAQATAATRMEEAQSVQATAAVLVAGEVNNTAAAPSVETTAALLVPTPLDHPQNSVASAVALSEEATVATIAGINSAETTSVPETTIASNRVITATVSAAATVVTV